MMEFNGLLPVLLGLALPVLAWCLALLVGIGLSIVARKPGLCLVAASALSLVRLGIRGVFVFAQISMMSWDVDMALIYRLHDLLATLLLVVAWALMGAAVLAWRTPADGEDDAGVPDYEPLA